ncbi:MAG: hypothetical protein IJ825_04205, partial [Oscillospiraceae bacterium]|nr:hypothetical protein [Oscillospiraceae bacterium]
WLMAFSFFLVYSFFLCCNYSIPRKRRTVKGLAKFSAFWYNRNENAKAFLFNLMPFYPEKTHDSAVIRHRARSRQHPDKEVNCHEGLSVYPRLQGQCH